MTRSRDIADQQKNAGGAVAPFVAGKNITINGAMDFWARGTSVTGIGTAKTFLADRWFANTGGGSTTFAYTRTTSVFTSFQYGIQIQRTASNTGTTAIYLQQDIETVNSIPYAGKTVTFSFYARAGANYSGSANGLNALLISGTGTDQTQYFAFYTGQTTVATGTTTLTTSWQRFTFTGTVPSNATQLGIQFNYAPTGTAGADDSFFITGVQVEQGSVATPFSRAGGSIGGELALCQRYYTRFTASGGYSPISTIFFANTSVNAYPTLPLAVPMRANITGVDWGGNMSLFDGVNRLTTITSITANSSVNNLAIITITMPSSMTTLRAYRLDDNGAGTAYIGFSAEL